MDLWTGNAIILEIRPYGDSGAIVTALTSDEGVIKGFYRQRSKDTPIQIGDEGQGEWKARLSDQLGNFQFEPTRQHSADLMDDQAALLALQSACALCSLSLQERQAVPELYDSLQALFLQLQNYDIAPQLQVFWEVGLLSTLGFTLQLNQCAATRTTENLTYVSPKTGRAVSLEAGEPYKHKLLKLPEFLKQNDRDEAVLGSNQDIFDGLSLTRYFFETHVFAQTHTVFPASRLRLEQLFAINENETNKMSS